MSDSREIPHDFIAEESMLGAMLLDAGANLEGTELCRASDFYRPMHQRVFSAMVKLENCGVYVDAVSVASELGEPDLVQKLVQMQLNTPSVAGLQTYAEIIRRHSAARELILQLGSSESALMAGANPYQEAERIEKFASGVGTVNLHEPESVTLEELEARADSIAPVVIPGMMHRDYRTIVVAEEGGGKSVLLRTIAMAAAQGFHPFSHQRIKPVRALIVDLENPAQAITQTASGFARMLRELDPENYDPERLRFWRKPGGIEIRSLNDKAELAREIAFHRPELVCIGPIYKMYHRGANETYEDSADGAMAVLDDLRTKYDFALVMEHHAAKGRKGERELTPMGSQRWMAWPEVGISLYPGAIDKTTMTVERYRGDRLQGVNWPNQIMRHPRWMVEGIWTEH